MNGLSLDWDELAYKNSCSVGNFRIQFGAFIRRKITNISELFD